MMKNSKKSVVSHSNGALAWQLAGASQVLPVLEVEEEEEEEEEEE